jgi:hypothetical protein
MMLLMTASIAILFVIAQISDSMSIQRLRRLDTACRIRLGLLSRCDIVRISHLRYTDRDFVYFPEISEYRSQRVYISTSDRLYRYCMSIDGQRYCDYISKTTARIQVMIETKAQKIETSYQMTNSATFAPVILHLSPVAL